MSIPHIQVHTGQNFDYELNQIFFDELGIRKPDYFLAVAGSNCSSEDCPSNRKFRRSI